MPQVTFNNTGGGVGVGATSRVDINSAAAGTVNRFLLLNHSGSAISVVIGFAARTTGNVYDTAGNLVVTGSSGASGISAPAFTLDADQTVVVDIVQDTGIGTNVQINSAQTVHGLSAKPGTGHTDARDDITPRLIFAEA